MLDFIQSPLMLCRLEVAVATCNIQGAQEPIRILSLRQAADENVFHPEDNSEGGDYEDSERGDYEKLMLIG